MSGSVICGRKLESGNCFSLPDSLRVSGYVCLGSRGKPAIQTGCSCTCILDDKSRVGKQKKKQKDISTSFCFLLQNESNSHEGLKDQISLAASPAEVNIAERLRLPTIPTGLPVHLCLPWLFFIYGKKKGCSFAVKHASALVFKVTAASNNVTSSC